MATLTTSYQLIKTGTGQQFGYAYGYLELYVKYNSQDRVNNTSSVSYRLNLVVSGGYIGDYNNNKPVIITGTTGSQTTYIGAGEYRSTELATYTETIQHNQDGTKSGSASASVNFTAWGQTLTTGAGNFDLPTIPRASKLTSATMTIASNGNSITVTPIFTKSVSSYYDQLLIKDNGGLVTTLNGVESGVPFSLNSSWVEAIFRNIGTATTKTFTCNLLTYTDSTRATYVGESSSVNLTATLPNYSISITSSVEETVTAYNTYKGSGNENKVYIANLSKPKFTFSASSSTGSYYGRTPTFTLNDASVTSPYTQNNYTGQTLTLKATDGRKTATNTPTMTHIAYFAPTLETKVTRTTPTGSTVDIQVNGTYYSGTGLTNLLTPTLTFKYTQSGGSEQTTTINLTTSTSGNKVTFSGTKQLTGMNYQKSVSWNATIRDRIGVTKVNSNVLSQGLPVWSAYRSNDTNYFVVNGNETVSGDTQINGSETVNGNMKVNGVATITEFRGKRLDGGSGTNGYMYAFDITSTGSYINQYIKFDVLQRGRCGTIYILFNSSGNTGEVAVRNIYKTGDINAYYIVSNNKFSLYIQKSEAYDNMEIFGLEKGSYMNAVSIAWKNQTVTSLPSGYSTISGNLTISGTLKSEGYFLYSLVALNASGRYYKLCNIPASANENACYVSIKGTIGNWTGTNRGQINFQITNRDALRIRCDYNGSDNLFDTQRIVVYKESNNSHTVYLYNATTYTGPNVLEITYGGYTLLPTIYTDYSYTTSPSGTLAYTTTNNNSGKNDCAVTLYNNASGSSGTITLSETSANFKFLEIWYRTNDGTQFRTSKIVPNPNGAVADLSYVRITTIGNTFLIAKNVTISGTSISTYESTDYSNTGIWYGDKNNVNHIYIIKVLGYR